MRKIFFCARGKARNSGAGRRNITMKEGVTHQGSRDLLLGNNPSEELVNLYSNELQVTESTPKAFIVLSNDDDVVPVRNSLDYAEALRNNNIPLSMHIYPEGGHGWGFNPEFKYHNLWIPELLGWLNDLYPVNEK